MKTLKQLKEAGVNYFEVISKIAYPLRFTGIMKHYRVENSTFHAPNIPDGVHKIEDVEEYRELYDKVRNLHRNALRLKQKEEPEVAYDSDGAVDIVGTMDLLKQIPKMSELPLIDTPSKRAYWLPEQVFYKWPPAGTDVLFIHSTNGAGPKKIRSGVVVDDIKGSVKEHVSGKVFYPYLSTVFQVGSIVKGVSSKLI